MLFSARSRRALESWDTGCSRQFRWVSVEETIGRPVHSINELERMRTCVLVMVIGSRDRSAHRLKLISYEYIINYKVGRTMKFQQLRYLVAVHENGLNITAAARQLHTSQPGVSRQLKLLEEELGFQ